MCVCCAVSQACPACTALLLQADSQAALAWLEAAGVDLSGTVQLGGHSRNRTHTSSRGPAGVAIMKALQGRLAAQPEERLRVVTGAKVGRGLVGGGGGGGARA